VPPLEWGMSLRAPRSSRTRFRDYLESRRSRGHLERIHESIDDSDEKRRARAARRGAIGLARRFGVLLSGFRLTIGLSLVTLSVSVALGLLLPLSTKIAIDFIITDNPGPVGFAPWIEGLENTRADRISLIWALGAVMLGVTALSVGFGIWGRWQCTRITKRVQVALRRRVFDHASRLPLHRIQHLKSGGIASVLREDAGGVGELVFSMIYNPWRAITQLLGTLVVLVWIDWRLVVGAIAIFPIIWVSHRTWITRIRPMYRDIRHRREGIDAMSAEAFSGIRVVRAFGRRQAEAARFTTEGHLLARQELHTWWWARILEIVWQVLIPLASTAVLVYGGIAVIDGVLTIGDLMAFSAYLLSLLGPLESLVSSATNVQTNLAALDRVIDLLDEEREFESTTPSVTLDPHAVRGGVSIRGLAYAYPRRSRSRRAGIDEASETQRGAEVLRGIDLEVAPGETIALVGASGAGKSTLCNLVARFDDPTRGSIALDGTDLREIPIEQYRKLLGIVEQEVFLFDGTVRDNIGYARRHADHDDIAHAARIANAHGFITELEHGYDTVIGERGVRLSGGQKQRLAIARAVLADPRILILDEATSSLDTESERLIQHALGALMRDRTCFVIAHRLSTIRHADRIVVIEDGTLLETGTHAQLEARGGRYATLLRMQLNADRDGADRVEPDRADALG